MERMQNPDVGIVIPADTVRENPTIREELRQLMQRYGTDLAAHIPPQ